MPKNFVSCVSKIALFEVVTFANSLLIIKIIKKDLFIFNVSLLDNNHLLTILSSIFNVFIRFSIFEFDIYNTLSSASVKFSKLIVLTMSFIHNINNIGPIIVPYGTMQIIFLTEEIEF